VSLPVSPLDENERLVPRDRVYDALVDLLISGRVAPGQALRIEHLANLLDVSPTPVREALAKIEATGLVTRVAQNGFLAAAPCSNATSTTNSPPPCSPPSKPTKTPSPSDPKPTPPSPAVGGGAVTA
jgi:DNA-binding transcriptional MocR family regulator